MKEAINLGEFQKELEASSRNLKSSETKLQNAQNAYLAAENRYTAARKALANAVTVVGAQTKVSV